MRFKRIFCMLMACMVSVSCLCVSAGAVNAENSAAVLSIERASGQFSMTIPAGTLSVADSSFPPEAGESVTIKASYTPFSAGVDFGLIAPDGLFYSVNVKSGSVDQTFDIDVRGNYTLAIRNNSSSSISVSGYVNY